MSIENTPLFQTNVEIPATAVHMPALEQRIPIIENSAESERELRWRIWQEKNRVADRRVERRMKKLFAIVSLIILLWVFYYILHVKGSHCVNRIDTLMENVCLDGIAEY